MNLNRYRTTWIIAFVIIKVLLLIFTFFMAAGDAYTDTQMQEVRGILFPTFAASLIVMFKYLRRQNEGQELEKTVNKVEYYMVLGFTVLYLLFVVGLLIGLKTEASEFLQLKSNITWVESFFAVVFGWVLSDIGTPKTD